MKAIVLTFDKYRILTDHMISRYNCMWPTHPFVFYIPFQQTEVKKYFEEKYGSTVHLIKTPSDIVRTMRVLLDNIQDEEWIYWCMDDRYPIQINLTKMNQVYSWIQTMNAPDVTGVRCINYPFGRMPENIYYFKDSIRNQYGMKFLKRKNNYNMIWAHQFMRIKVLKRLFSEIPLELKAAKDMDFIVEKLQMPEDYNLYVLKSNIISLGESSSRGKITRNCYESLLENGFKIPKEFEINNKKMYYKDEYPMISSSYLFLKQIIKTLMTKIGLSIINKKRQ